MQRWSSHFEIYRSICLVANVCWIILQIFHARCIWIGFSACIWTIVSINRHTNSFASCIDSDIAHFRHSVPYNWRTPAAYLFTTLLEFIEAYTMAVVFVCSLSIYFGICMYLMSFCELLQQYFDHLNEEMGKTASSSVERVKLKRLFIEIIQFHADVKQLSWLLLFSSRIAEKFSTNIELIVHSMQRLTKSALASLADLVSILFFNSSMVWCVGLLAFQLVSIFRLSIDYAYYNKDDFKMFFKCYNQGLTLGDNLLILSTASAVCSWMAFYFLVCNLGDNVSNAIERLHQSIYLTSWHLCPVEQQKWVILMLAASQNPVLVKGHASITSSRVLYKQVL